MPQQPVLDEENRRTDWLKARYVPQIQIQNRDKAHVSHNITGSPALVRGIKKRAIVASTELRCPQTLYSHRVITSPEDVKIISENKATIDHIIKIPETEIKGDAYILVGLASSKKSYLKTDELDGFIWGETDRQLIEQGWKIARSAPRRVKNLMQSLIKFKVDRALKDGRIRIETRNEDMCFIVHVAENIKHEPLKNKDVARAALIGVCAEFPKARFLDEESQTILARNLRGTLQGRTDKPHLIEWENKEEFDPAYTATLLEPFEATTVENED